MTEELDHSWLRQASTDPGHVKVLYDQWAATYDETLRTWGYEAPQLAARTLVDAVGPTAYVLDVGCGTGLTGAALRTAGLTGDIDGIDLSPASLAQAQGKGVYASLAEVDLQGLPLPIDSDRYDALLCVGVLTYVSNDDALLRDFARVLRGGGTMVLTQRTDLFAERSYGTLLDGLSGILGGVQVSAPLPYLPGNAQYGSQIKTLLITARAA